LSREFLFYPGNLSRDRAGSGLCVAREPHLPRTPMAARVAWPYPT